MTVTIKDTHDCRLLTECLAIREDVSGTVHPETQRTAQQLVTLYRKQGRKEDMMRIQKSLSQWRRQVAIWQLMIISC